MPGAIEARVIAILARQARIEAATLRPETTLEELSLDSMALVEVIFALEEEFDITVPFNANRPEESASDMASVASIVRAVELLLAERAD
jgi:acyl carrier protein